MLDEIPLLRWHSCFCGFERVEQLDRLLRSALLQRIYRWLQPAVVVAARLRAVLLVKLYSLQHEILSRLEIPHGNLNRHDRELRVL